MLEGENSHSRLGRKKVEFDMFKALKYPANDGNFYKVDMIDVIVKEEFEKVSIADSIDKLVSHPSDGEFERFLEQLELEISKSKERRHETAHLAENLQNCGPEEEFADRKKCKNGSRKFQSQNCGLQFCPAITFSTPEVSNSTQTSSSSPKVELKPLPSTLRYEYLGLNESYPVIIMQRSMETKPVNFFPS
jgi:hypothetical protein